ncbi:YqjF family protein [Sulfuriroseicoccus oceanibius]|uniref:DUF2071 domain-containing protein n=1 Tax=Sulfuriroseicoccus oceanibius TaxID=2707525 RepID=A0A6B3L834_9BACT|nr:DUF2071 domain-containing protein [Sulfuriroseicoccus oceanibius]QQL46252.1 DUF2071 domain-containing protein [Sulfuriroseicoccus oceanibius]
MAHPSLAFTDHRPWPLPDQRWRWRQSWNDLAFVHYKVDAKRLRELVPAKYEIDRFAGDAWVSVVPFMMEDVAPQGMPCVFPFRSFPELNLRTYVTHGGKPGVFFFSLDAANLPLVVGGNAIYGVPYKYARMAYIQRDGVREFVSRRYGSAVNFRAMIKPLGPEFEAAAGTLEEWLSERYCLYSVGVAGAYYRVEVHHKKWPLRECAVELIENDLLKPFGLEVDESSALCHFSPGVDVVSFRPERLD